MTAIAILIMIGIYALKTAAIMLLAYLMVQWVKRWPCFRRAVEPVPVTIVPSNGLANVPEEDRQRTARLAETLRAEQAERDARRNEQQVSVRVSRPTPRYAFTFDTRQADTHNVIPEIPARRPDLRYIPREDQILRRRQMLHPGLAASRLFIAAPSRRTVDTNDIPNRLIRREI